MKKYIYLALFSLIVFSCKKQEQPGTNMGTTSNDSYTANVKAYLKSNLYDTDFVKVDLNNSVLSKQGKDWYLRIALLNKNLSRDFVLLQTDSLGICSIGKFVHIRRDSSDMKTFNGKISTAGFNHAATIKKVDNNIASTLDCDEDEESVEAADDCAMLVPACSGCLPEVVVVGYINSNNSGSAGSISYSDYISLSNLVTTALPNGATPAPSSVVYSPLAPAGSPKPAKPSADLVVNYEANASRPGIDVKAFMKCFSAIPDAGAECSVTVYTDLPVDDNPSYIFNILTGATGHCFIQLTKTNGTQSVTQIIGKTTSKAIAVLGFPVPGKIVDNTAHKYNASIKMEITPAQLQTEINAVTATGNTQQYDMWENNCVNYAVGMMNLLRPNDPLDVGLTLDPSSDESYETPQGLYIALEKLKLENTPDAPYITMNVVQHVGAGHGPCN